MWFVGRRQGQTHLTMVFLWAVLVLVQTFRCDQVVWRDHRRRALVFASAGEVIRIAAGLRCQIFWVAVATKVLSLAVAEKLAVVRHTELLGRKTRVNFSQM